MQQCDTWLMYQAENEANKHDRTEQQQNSNKKKKTKKRTEKENIR
jgi:hypothetical protein